MAGNSRYGPYTFHNHWLLQLGAAIQFATLLGGPLFTLARWLIRHLLFVWSGTVNS